MGAEDTKARSKLYKRLDALDTAFLLSLSNTELATLKSTIQQDINLQTLENINQQLKLMNLYLSSIVGEQFTKEDIE